MYNKSIVAADKINMESRLKEEMVAEFTKIKESQECITLYPRRDDGVLSRWSCYLRTLQKVS